MRCEHDLSCPFISSSFCFSASVSDLLMKVSFSCFFGSVFFFYSVLTCLSSLSVCPLVRCFIPWFPLQLLLVLWSSVIWCFLRVCFPLSGHLFYVLLEVVVLKISLVTWFIIWFLEFIFIYPVSSSSWAIFWWLLLIFFRFCLIWKGSLVHGWLPKFFRSFFSSSVLPLTHLFRFVP